MELMQDANCHIIVCTPQNDQVHCHHSSHHHQSGYPKPTSNADTHEKQVRYGSYLFCYLIFPLHDGVLIFYSPMKQSEPISIGMPMERERRERINPESERAEGRRW